MIDMKELGAADPQLASAIMQELDRQRNSVELIASENIVSIPVLQAMGTWLTNKYSEGFPSKRYYGGNQFIDVAENLAIERLKKLFGAEHANVQPHSGSQANMESYFAVLNRGDRILGMSLDHGGHLTHGHKVNFSGRFYDFCSYGVDRQTERIDMDEVRRIALLERPRMILAGASAYCREIDFSAFRQIADEVGAYFMVDMAHIAGLIAAGLHTDPIPFADIVTTTTHKTLRGPRGAAILSRVEDRLNPDNKKNLAQKIDSAVFPGMQGGPLDHVIAAKAVAFGEALQPDFVTYQGQVKKNASVLANTLMDYGFRLVSGGTDNHMMLVDLANMGISGKEAETLLDRAHICCNKNMIPFDSRPPFDPSGIRLGTPAITTRGMKEAEIRFIGECIHKVISSKGDEGIISHVRSDISELCARFPIYPGI